MGYPRVPRIKTVAVRKHNGVKLKSFLKLGVTDYVIKGPQRVLLPFENILSEVQSEILALKIKVIFCQM